MSEIITRHVSPYYTVQGEPEYVERHVGRAHSPHRGPAQTPIDTADLCASGQQVRAVMNALWPILGGNHLEAEMWDKISDGVTAALTPAPQAATATAQEAVPVAWGESYDGGAFFNTVSLTKTKHHTYPLYAHTPQPSVTVAEAAQVLINAIHDLDGIAVVNMDKQQKALFLLDRLALHTLKGERG